MENRDYKSRFIIHFIYIGIIITIAYFLIKYLLGPLIPFITAFIIVSLSDKFIVYLSDIAGSKKTASIIFTLLLILLLSAILYILVFGLFSEVLRLSQSISIQSMDGLWSKAESLFVRFHRFISGNRLFSRISELFSYIFSSNTESFSEYISKAIPVILKFLGKFLSFFPAAVIFICIMFLSMFYIGSDYDRIKDFLLMQIPDRYKDTFEETKNVFISTAKELFKSYFLLTFFTFVQLFIGFIIIGIDYSLILALIICLVDLLPILGTGTVLIPWSAVYFLLGNYPKAIGLLVLYAVIALFRQIAEPRIVGAGIGLSPLLSLISIFVGLKLFGFIGIIISPIILMTVIRLNEKGFIRLYKTFPEKEGDRISKTRTKFLDFKRQDKNE